VLTTVVCVALLVLGLCLLLFGSSIPFRKVIGGALVAVAALVLLFASTTVIEAKNVGVLTTFGKPSGTLDSGLHLKLPWQRVTELDGTKITNKYEGTHAVEVRIGDGTTAHVKTAIRWSIVGDKADDIYADYRSDDVNETVNESLVETVFSNALNQVLGDYNPTANLRVVNPDEQGSVSISFVPDYDDLAAKVTASMEQRVADAGGYIKIDFITISGLTLSETTQAKINEFQAEVAKTQVALQKKATAAAQAEANKTLSDSVSNNPNVLVSRCLDTYQQMVDEAQPIPAGGINCWPGADSDLVLAPSAPTAKE